MVIQHTMAADFGLRQSKINNQGKVKATERLSSGYRINRAGDDASGLAISEKMRAQIAGLNQAKRSVVDGISLVQTADGAMQEMSNILVRMRELAVQGANDTNTDSDREKLQLEIEALNAEMGRISNQTEYNSMKILNNTWKEKDATITLADIVGKENITPSGTLSNIQSNTAIIDYTNGAALVTKPGPSFYNPILSVETVRTQVIGGQITHSYSNLSYTDPTTGAAVGYTSGSIYDGAGNVIGSVAGGTVSMNPPYGSTAITPGTISVTKNNLYEYVDPATNNTNSYNGGTGTPIITNPTTVGSSTTVTTPTPGAQGLFMRDASGNLIGLSYTLQDTTTQTIHTYKDYENYNETLKSAVIDFGNLNQPNGFGISDLIGKGFNSTCATCDRHYSVKFVTGTANAFVQNGTDYVLQIGISGLTNTSTGADLAELVINTLKDPVASRFASHYTQYSAVGSKLYLFDVRHSVVSGGSDTFDPWVFEEEGEFRPLFRVQTGSNSGNEMTMKLPWVTPEKLRINGVSVLSHDSASNSLNMIDRAVEILNGERSRMGAYQNRLEHARERVAVAAEELTSSESKIRDTNMPETIMKQSKYSILEQAAFSIVSQANQQMEQVLGLLQ